MDENAKEIDKKIVSLASETNLQTRDTTIAEIWAQIQQDLLYLPIHHQVLNWGMANKVQTTVSPDDRARFKYFTIK